MNDTPGGYISKDLNILTIKKDTKILLPMWLLYRQVLKYCFDQKHMSLQDISDMMNSITNYYDYIKSEKEKLAEKYGYKYVYENPVEVGKKGTPLDSLEFWLQICAGYLYKLETGKLDKIKYTIIEHCLDYRKMFFLSEAYKKEDFEKAQENYKKWLEKNPEYDVTKN